MALKWWCHEGREEKTVLGVRIGYGQVKTEKERQAPVLGLYCGVRRGSWITGATGRGKLGNRWLSIRRQRAEI